MISCQLTKQLHFPAGSHELSVSFSVAKNSIMAIYGPSGSGKTSILRMICGLMPVSKGKVTIDKETWIDSELGITAPPKNRGIGMVFQDYALFPHMTVLQNLRFAQSQRDERLIADVIDTMGLKAFVSSTPRHLSGGQKQRVALARAIVQKPRLLLLDEPLAALDREMRSSLQAYLLQVKKKFAFPIIIVSHDVEEIFRLSDQVIHLKQGMVVRQGTPLQVFGSTSETNQLGLKGRLVATNPNKNGMIYVLIGSQVYEISVPTSLIDSLQIGEMLDLKATTASIVVSAAPQVNITV